MQAYLKTPNQPSGVQRLASVSAIGDPRELSPWSSTGERLGISSPARLLSSGLIRSGSKLLEKSSLFLIDRSLIKAQCNI